jgi:pimeloyl-ACP methyl ester carboxylesterase
MPATVTAPGKPRLRAVPTGSQVVRLRYRTVHGHRRAFRMAGNGPVVLLIHGIGDSSETWAPVIPGLARHYRVIAPDLLGHGHSDKPRGDYSIGGYANGMRDLLSVLGVDRATLVGHSLGGGVAMQFAYQYPDHCERLVLVSTGGVGREVHPALRLVSMPNAGLGLNVLRLPAARLTARIGAKVLNRLGTDLGLDAEDLLRVFDSMPDRTSRAAVIRTLRAVVDRHGQMVTMLDRCYLGRSLPTLLVWGARDPIIPVAHAHIAHAALPASRLEIIESAGHFPHHSEPARFVTVLADFLATTTPAHHDVGRWRDLLRAGRPDEFSDAHAALTEETISAAHRSAT